MGNYNRFCCLLFCLLCCGSSFAQKGKLNAIDQELTNSYKALIANRAKEPDLIDSTTSAFEEMMKKYLLDSVTFDGSLKNLSKYILIRQSADKKIKFYSWNTLRIGNWRDVISLAQFESSKGQIVITQLDNVSEDLNEDQLASYNDAEIYEVHQLIINNKVSYLTLAYGKHGGGNKHSIVRIFQLENGQLLKCRSCFAKNRDLAIECPTHHPLDLFFNPEKNEITYTDFFIDDEERYHMKGKVTLKLINGVFVKQ